MPQAHPVPLRGSQLHVLHIPADHCPSPRSVPARDTRASGFDRTAMAYDSPKRNSSSSSEIADGGLGIVK
jgi:hypothetical protein